jgi:hypothetical protein
MNYHALCFVDMPFGQKPDLKSGVLVDFDQIYDNAIKPAIEQCGLEPLRGDEESTGGIIHSAMFARLLLAEFVVADLTLANANVFYELGIRHAAKPFTTVPIFANVSAAFRCRAGSCCWLPAKKRETHQDSVAKTQIPARKTFVRRDQRLRRTTARFFN